MSDDNEIKNSLYKHIGCNHIEKHEKYKVSYKPNSTYWGFGIENELYLMFDKKIIVSETKFLKNHKKERYSVDYYKSYDPSFLEWAFPKYLKKEEIQINPVAKSNLDFMQINPIGSIEIPLYMNSHSFLYTDTENQSKTIYTISPCPRNPYFNGEVLMETLENNNPYFIENQDKTFVFDGDTVEFMTNNFINPTLHNVLYELETNKMEFISALRNAFIEEDIFQYHGEIGFQTENHPFAMHLTNMGQVSMFNNGTIHINLTLPTELDKNCNIVDKPRFIREHKAAIALIQWMEPFFITIYGSPDPFSNLLLENTEKFVSACSQRCALSRYIGIGTYDTDKMETGKILTRTLEELSLDYWWYNEFHKESYYEKLDKVGMDINFNKHYNHGIELRFLDYIPDREKLREVCEFIIYLMDKVLENPEIKIENPIKNKLWNNLVVNCMKYGLNYSLTIEEVSYYENLLNIKLPKENPTIEKIYKKMLEKMRKREKGIYSKLMMPPKKPSMLQEFISCIKSYFHSYCNLS